MIKLQDRLHKEIQVLDKIEEFLFIPKILRDKNPKLDIFNLFTVLRGSNDEVHLHSRFLAELLDPKGKHGLGNIFLKLFITQIFKGFEFDVEDVAVDKEWDNIDIFIRNSVGQAIILENKIDAIDQEHQLSRYYSLVQDQTYQSENIRILYLSLDGHTPSDQSTKGLSKEFIKENLLNISYETDIKSWLSVCLKEAVSIPSLRESISQYIELIADLTHTNQSEQLMTELQKWFQKELKNDSPVDLINTLVRTKEEYHAKCLFKLVNSIKQEIKNFSQNEIDIDDEYTTTDMDGCKDFISGKDCYEVLINPIKNNKKVSVLFAAEKGKGYIQIWCEKNKTTKLYESIKSILANKATEYTHSNNYAPGWKYIKNPIILYEATDESLRNLSDDEFIRSLAKEIAQELCRITSLLTENLEAKTTK